MASLYSATMSTAHRPTWDPAQAREVKGGSRQYSSRDMAAHTKLKFRQPGQTSAAEVMKRDLRLELLAAEEEARERKRKAEGLPPTKPTAAIENGTSTSNGEDEANKRRKLLQEAIELDKDDDDDDDDERRPADKDDGEKNEDDEEKDEDDEDEDDEDDDEDETAELLRELEKIKRERAAEKARQESEKSASDALVRDFEIATANPLLNLQAALGQASAPAGGFAVKRRWDDDLIFKNQAMNDSKTGGQFVNDLLRTEFHKKFMSKFIK